MNKHEHQTQEDRLRTPILRAKLIQIQKALNNIGNQSDPNSMCQTVIHQGALKKMSPGAARQFTDVRD